MSTNATNASSKIVGFIMEHETLSEFPIKDSKGRWAIGYGHLILEGESYERINQEIAKKLLMADIYQNEVYVLNYAKEIGVSLTQIQLDALISFSYNVGVTNLHYLMNELFIDNMDPTDAFSQYCKREGKTTWSLYYRRIDEANIFLYGVYRKSRVEVPVG